MSLPPELQSALLSRRVVFLRGRLDEATANNVIAQLLLVAHTSAGRTIELYVDSPGGSVAAALSVFDVMQTSAAPVSTTCIGTVGGASVLVLAGGASGLRFALENRSQGNVDIDIFQRWTIHSSPSLKITSNFCNQRVAV